MSLVELRLGPMAEALAEDTDLLLSRLRGLGTSRPRPGAGMGWIACPLPSAPIDCYLPHSRGRKQVRVKGTLAFQGTIAVRRLICMRASVTVRDDGTNLEPEWQETLATPGVAFARWRRDAAALRDATNRYLRDVPGRDDPPMLDLSAQARRRLSDFSMSLTKGLESGAGLTVGTLPLKVPVHRARLTVTEGPPLCEVETVRSGREEVLMASVCDVATAERSTSRLVQDASAALEHVLVHKWMLSVARVSLARQKHAVALLLSASDGDAPQFRTKSLDIIRLRLQLASALGSGWSLGLALEPGVQELAADIGAQLHLSDAWEALQRDRAALNEAVDLCLRLPSASATTPDPLLPTSLESA